MDKKIEELKETLRRRCVEGEVASCVDADCYLCEAKFLINAGYRKIPENAVVLTGTETEERFEDLLIDFDEMSFYPATTCPNPEEYAREWKRKLIYAIGQLKKETAEKFARLVEFHSVSTRDNDGREIFTISALGLKEILHEEFGIPYDEICKEITEGKV